MKRKLIFLTLILTLAAAVFAVPASADAPNFGPAIYADGRAWGTKGLSDLPPPTENNSQSFDFLFRFTNGVAGQLAVAEAGPRNPSFNGGRWSVQVATWVEGADPVLITSYDQLMAYVDSGELMVTSANTYFLCPLLPVK